MVSHTSFSSRNRQTELRTMIAPCLVVRRLRSSVRAADGKKCSVAMSRDCAHLVVARSVRGAAAGVAQGGCFVPAPSWFEPHRLRCRRGVWNESYEQEREAGDIAARLRELATLLREKLPAAARADPRAGAPSPSPAAADARGNRGEDIRREMAELLRRYEVLTGEAFES
jgi:hypothetical protein